MQFTTPKLNQEPQTATHITYNSRLDPPKDLKQAMCAGMGIAEPVSKPLLS